LDERGSAVRILFLDRDGTLNRSLGRRPPNTPGEVELLPGVPATLSHYVAEGWLLVIVSNQGGVASGYISEAAAHAVQRQVVDLLPVPVAASYFCPHMPNGRVAEYAIDCPNRKPRPGFVLLALQEFGARAEDCLFVGDSSTDREAAETAGVAFVWADLFFRRRIDRGLLTTSGDWVQVREPQEEDGPALKSLTGLHLDGPCESGQQEGALTLVALMGGAPVGWLRLARRKLGTEADLILDVPASHRNLGIGSLMLETALSWASAQEGLRRLCVDVRADDPDLSSIYCQFGFAHQGQEAAKSGKGREQFTLACDL
jgi:D-glycero-D-manno-heptose 1,7-bisphosphate phosphatase